MLVVWINKIHQDELEFRRLEKVLERISAQEEYLRMVKDEMLCPLRHHPATAELRIFEGHLDTSGGALGRIQFLRRLSRCSSRGLPPAALGLVPRERHSVFS